MWSGVLTGNDTRWHSASSGSPLPERTDFGWTPQSAAITDPPRPQPAALWPSPRNVVRQRLAIFSNEYYQILIATPTASKHWRINGQKFLQDARPAAQPTASTYWRHMIHSNPGSIPTDNYSCHLVSRKIVPNKIKNTGHLVDSSKDITLPVYVSRDLFFSDQSPLRMECQAKHLEVGREEVHFVMLQQFNITITTI